MSLIYKCSAQSSIIYFIEEENMFAHAFLTSIFSTKSGPLFEFEFDRSF